MSLPGAADLDRDLPSLPHVERVRLLVRTARAHAHDPALGTLLDELAARSAYHAGLVVDAARAVGDTQRLRALTRHPSPGVRVRALGALPLEPADPQELADTYLTLPLAERRLMATRLGRENRHDLVDALLDLPLGDRERARLLSKASAPKAAELLADLADLVPSLAALATRHPDVVLDVLTERLAHAAPAGRDDAWAWAAPALRRLAEHRPARLLALLVSHGPTAVIPRALNRHLGLLADHDPQALTDLLVACPWRAGVVPTASSVLVRSLRRRVNRLSEPQLAALARAWSREDHRLAALLHALAPSRRAEVLRAGLAGERTETRVWHGAVLDVLPTPLRQVEAERIADLPTQTAPLRRLGLAAYMSPERARDLAADRLHAWDADERAAAWQALIGSAARSRQADELATVLQRLPEAANEQDPVRQEIAEALAQVPVGMLARCGTDHLVGLAQAVLEARDTSALTLHSLQTTAWRLLVHAAAACQPTEGPLRLLEVLADQDQAVYVPHRLDLPDRVAAELIEALQPLLERAAERQSFALTLRLWRALRRKAWRNESLLALVRRALGAPANHVRAQAAEALLEDPATRAARTGQLLDLDPTFATLRPVQEAVCRTRQDLVTVFFRPKPLRGRFWKSRHRYVPADLPGPYSMWHPDHQRAYADALRLALGSWLNTDWDRRRVAATLTALPVTRGEDLTDLLDQPTVQVVEGVLAALPALDDPEAALHLLLPHTATDRARVAVFAAARCAWRLDPVRAAALVAPLLDPPARVTARKEAVRVLARLRAPGCLSTLVSLGTDSGTHRDVRAALVQALTDHLDEPETWQVMESLASQGRDAVLALAAVSPGSVPRRHCARWARLLVSLPPQPEVLGSLRQWSAELVDLPAPLREAVLDGDEVTASYAVQAVAACAARAVDWRPFLELVASLQERARDPREPNAADRDDLPHLRRLEELVVTATRPTGAGWGWYRPRLLGLADRLSGSPSTARLATRARLAAVDWGEALADLTAVADQVTDPTLWADLLQDTRDALALARDQRLLPTEGIGPAVVDALSERGDGAAGVLALALTEDQGDGSGWPQQWRERLRDLRTHTVALVARRAQEVSTV